MEISRLNQAEFEAAYGILCAPVAPQHIRPGISPTFCRIPSSKKTTAHAHFEPEVFFIIEGKGRMRIGAEWADVAAGDLIRIPPFNDHELENKGVGDLVFLSVYSEDIEIPQPSCDVLLTVAPPTPNGPLHLGHISGPYLAGDILTRFLRLRKAKIRSHCGTDDHQNYVGAKARGSAMSPEPFRHAMRTRILKGLSAQEIRFDEFIEPKTDQTYQEKILRFARRAIESGVVEPAVIEFPFCAECDRTLIDADIDGRCPSCGEPSKGGCENCGLVTAPHELLEPRCALGHGPAIRRRTSAFVFPLSRFLPLIESDLNRLGLSPRLRELASRIHAKANLNVLVTHPAASGESLILPGTDQALHVWFEMAAHYEEFAHSSGEWIHCFGFDNAFHYLFFIPALLKALNAEAKAPDTAIVNEFLNLEGSKFSTSRGHAIWADEFDGNADHLRLFLCINRPMSEGADFSLEKFRRFSIELEASLAKLLAGVSNSTVSRDRKAILDANRFTRDMELFYSPATFDPRRFGRRIIEFLDVAIHSPGDHLRARALATAMAPVLPNESAKLLRALGDECAEWVTDWAGVP